MNKSGITSFLKVVLIDDSLIILERLKQILSDVDIIEICGYARNITGAVQLIDNKKPDVVLLDIHLPDDAPHKNGMDLLTQLRKEYENMVIIMLTNLAEQHYRDKCISLGADYFFDKSNDFEMMSDTIIEMAQSHNS